MARFIEEFYYGNIDPQARSTKKNKTVQKEMATLTKTEELLTNALTDEPKEWFLDFANAWSVVNGESNLDSFIMGFRLGANFAYDAFMSPTLIHLRTRVLDGVVVYILQSFQTVLVCIAYTPTGNPQSAYIERAELTEDNQIIIKFRFRKLQTISSSKSFTIGRGGMYSAATNVNDARRAKRLPRHQCFDY